MRYAQNIQKKLRLKKTDTIKNTAKSKLKSDTKLKHYLPTSFPYKAQSVNIR